MQTETKNSLRINSQTPNEGNLRTNDLELSNVILEVADDLCHGCQMSEYSRLEDSELISKYIHMHCPVRQKPVVFFWKDNEKNRCFYKWFRRRFVITSLYLRRYLYVRL